jgi:CheY-like chemotaxis protein
MLKVILFLDDNPARHTVMDARYPNDLVVHAYDIHAFRAALEEHERFDMISLDHDLNDFEARSYIGDSDATGRDACGYMMKYRDKLPPVIIIHSGNDDGSKDMAEFLASRGVVSRRRILYPL